MHSSLAILVNCYCFSPENKNIEKIKGTFTDEAWCENFGDILDLINTIFNREIGGYEMRMGLDFGFVCWGINITPWDTME